MQCLTHVMRLLVVMCIGLYPLQAAATKVQIDENYCHGLALVAHSTAEARQRSEPIAQWRKNLLSLKGYGVKDNDNVLYKVLPKAVQEIHGIYTRRHEPPDAYMASFNSCMEEDYGKVVVVR